MPYAPTVNDNSGQILAAGINQGIAQLAQGLERNMAERKKKEEDRKAKEAVTSAGKALYGEAFDLKDAPKEDWGKIIQLSQAKQEEPLRQLQMENAQLRQKIDLAQFEQMGAALQQQQTDRKAIGNAMASPWADQSMGAAARRALENGASTRSAMELAQLGEVVSQTKDREAQTRARGMPGPSAGMLFPNKASLDAKFPGDKFDYQFTEDPATGVVTVPKVSPRAPAPPTPNKFRDALDEGLGKQVSAVVERVPEFNNTLEQVQRGRAALAAGATTGGLAETKLAAAQTINGLVGSEVFKTGPSELAKTTFSDMALTAATRMRGQGQITESERKILADTVAKLGNSPEALGYIMNYIEAAATRSLSKAQALQSLRDTGELDAAKYSRVLTTWEKENPIKLEAVGAVPASAKLPAGWSIRQ